MSLSETCLLFFSTLANPTRLAILELLRDEPKDTAEVSIALNREQSEISQNLELLKRRGFIFEKRSSKSRFYVLNKETMESLFKTISYHSKKYCPEEGNCLTYKDLADRKVKDASGPVYLVRR